MIRKLPIILSKRQITLYVFCSMFLLNGLSQNKLSTKDSINKLLEHVGSGFGNFDLNYKLTNQAITLANQINDRELIIKANLRMGDVLWYKGIFGRSEEYYLKVMNQTSDKIFPVHHAYALYSVGWIECVQKNRVSRMYLLRKARTIYEQLKDTSGLLLIANAISGSYGSYHEKTGNTAFIDSSIVYLNYALNICKSSSTYYHKKAHFYSNISEKYYSKKDYITALHLVDTALQLSLKYNNTDVLLHSYIIKAKVLVELNRINEGIDLLESKMKMIKDHGEIQKIIESNHYLYLFYKKKGDNQKALEHFEIYNVLYDKANEELLNEKYEQVEANAKIYKNEKNIAELKKKNEMYLMQEKQRANILILGTIILLVVSGSLVLIIRRNRKINRLNSDISKQKELIEEKHLEIKDSINYAKRIQDAILPSSNQLQSYLKNGFVYFNPKDVVSGDFYWMEKVGEAIYFAVADCTGHGVPGAMVSVVCSNALSKALLEDKIQETGKLLNRTRELVIQSFSGNDSDVKDGMDISLCKLDGFNLQWSGANNPLWILKNSSGEILEIKADKQPIGKTDHAKSFTTHNLQLEKNDTIYLFSDGFADQFGGEKGKKYMYKPLKNLLEKVATKNMDEQNEILSTEFNRWKGSLEQVDDVCIIGVRI